MIRFVGTLDLGITDHITLHEVVVVKDTDRHIDTLTDRAGLNADGADANCTEAIASERTTLTQAGAADAKATAGRAFSQFWSFQNPQHDLSELHKIRRSTDIEALK